jgi:hypothetical protein
MWYGQDDELVLQPKHALIFKTGAGSLLSRVGEKYMEEWETGVFVFDELTPGANHAAILAVAKALLDPLVEAPDVTAVLAGTVDAIYREFEGLLESEIAFAEEVDLRQMVLDAMEECGHWEAVKDAFPDDEDEQPPRPPAADCNDSDEWSWLIESLRETLLEDYDFDMAERFLDMAPEAAANLKKRMNIDPDYFVAVVRDPSPAELTEIRRELWALVKTD